MLVLAVLPQPTGHGQPTSWFVWLDQHFHLSKHIFLKLNFCLSNELMQLTNPQEWPFHVLIPWRILWKYIDNFLSLGCSIGIRVLNVDSQAWDPVPSQEALCCFCNNRHPHYYHPLPLWSCIPQASWWQLIATVHVGLGQWGLIGSWRLEGQRRIGFSHPV